jgi:anti-sigma B factor antagonist
VDINMRKRASVQVIQLRGALRMGEAVDRFRQTLDEAATSGDNKVVLDLSEMPSIDSSGIGVLVKAMASAKQRGGALKLINPSKFAVQTLRLVGVLNLFEIFQDEETAVASFQ